MHIHEINAAISAIAAAPYDEEEFPFDFIRAFDHNEKVIERLRTGGTNLSRINGVLLQGQIHIKIASLGNVGGTIQELLGAGETRAEKNRVRFVLATDGNVVAARKTSYGRVIRDAERISVRFRDLWEKVYFFLPLAGIIALLTDRNTDSDFQVSTTEILRIYLKSGIKLEGYFIHSDSKYIYFFRGGEEFCIPRSHIEYIIPITNHDTFPITMLEKPIHAQTQNPGEIQSFGTSGFAIPKPNSASDNLVISSDDSKNLLGNDEPDSSEKSETALIEQLISATQLYNTETAVREVITFTKKLRRFAPFNALLLHIQKPGLTHAASAGDWHVRFGRVPKIGARPLVILGSRV